MPGTFGRKPSDSHVIWRSGGPRGEKGKKRFDFEYMEMWCAHFGIDYEEYTRVDHERAEEPRKQHVCVFTYKKSEAKELSMGDKTVELGQQEKPHTFVEVDEAGEVRIHSWEAEAVFDVDELWLDGPKFKMKTTEGNKSVDGRRLAKKPDKKKT